MSFQYAKINTIDTDQINNSSLPKCIYRLGINPISNPDPTIGGLIVNSTQTEPGPFNIPLTDQPASIGMADNFKIDPDNCLTLQGDKIKCNRTGKYQMNLCLALLFPLWEPLNIIVCQLLINGQSVFTAPPGLNSGLPELLLPTMSPVFPLFNSGCFLNSSQIVSLNTNDEISLVLKFYYGTTVIALTSGLSINLII